MADLLTATLAVVHQLTVVTAMLTLTRPQRY